MTTTIVASYNVNPNEATPNDPLWLSDSDQIGNLRHILTIYIYKVKSKHNHNTIIERMRDSLSKILVYYYPLAGRLRLAKSGRMEVDCNTKGVTLLEAETTNTLNDYGDFSPSESTEELVPKIDYSGPIEELPLLLVQVTRLDGGEGLSIGFAWSHVLGDGISATLFINRWAKMVRGEALNPNEMPFLDRTVLKLLPVLESSSSGVNVGLPEWKPAPLTSDNIIADQQKKARVALSMKLSSSQVEKLKKKANHDHASKEEGVRPYSRFETIAAHIWRCASKARYESGENNNQPTLVRFSVDIRNRLVPPLPQNYFGNALAKTVTPNCCVGDIISNPLSYGAQKIRETSYVVTNEYIRSQLSVILGQEQLDSINAFFTGQGHRINVPYAGNHNILLSSWLSMPMYEANFGWGKAMHIGLANVSKEDKAKIIQSPDGDGVVVSVNFQKAYMQLFNKFFYEDI